MRCASLHKGVHGTRSCLWGVSRWDAYTHCYRFANLIVHDDMPDRKPNMKSLKLITSETAQSSRYFIFSEISLRGARVVPKLHIAERASPFYLSVLRGRLDWHAFVQRFVSQRPHQMRKTKKSKVGFHPLCRGRTENRARVNI